MQEEFVTEVDLCFMPSLNIKHNSSTAKRINSWRPATQKVKVSWIVDFDMREWGIKQIWASMIEQEIKFIIADENDENEIDASVRIGLHGDETVFEVENGGFRPDTLTLFYGENGYERCELS